MKKKSNEKSKFIEKIKHNTFRFLAMMGFIMAYMAIFGQENTLPGVAIYVGIMMFPKMNTGIKLYDMLIMVAILFLGSGIVAQIGVISPWLALPLNIIYIFITMIVTTEPAPYRMNMVFLLPLLFCQSVPVTIDLFPKRMLGMLIATVITVVVTYIEWKKRSYGKEGRTLKEQIKEGMKYIDVSARMAIGVSLAIFIAALMNSAKPLWISIVVMSLTQIDTSDMVDRIKYRTTATVCGIFFFSIVFGYIFPVEYAAVLVMILGYVGFFIDKYKYKQFINFISSINASLIIFNAETAMVNRFVGLFIGIAIVLVLHIISSGTKLLLEKISDKEIDLIDVEY